MTRKQAAARSRAHASERVIEERRGMTVAYSGPGGFVTDMGAPLVLERTDGDTGEDITIPRYGVWRTVDGRPQVVMTTNDLDAAIKEARQ